MSHPQTVSRSEFARLCGVSPAAVTKALGGPLAGAKCGKYVDVAHPAAVAYRKAKEAGPRARVAKGKPTPAKKQQRKKKRAPGKNASPRKARIPRGREAAKDKELLEPPPKPIDRIPEDLRDMMDMPMREFVEMFATDHRMKTWLDGAKTIEAIHTARVKNAKESGKLVSRDMVQQYFLNPVEEFHMKLLTDFVKTVTSRLGAKIRTDANNEECEAEVRKQIERFMKPMKRKILKGLSIGN